MVVQCYSWIVYLLKQILGGDDDDVAVEDTTLDQTILQWRRSVCKEWQRLTSSSNGGGLHEDRPLILRYFIPSYLYSDNELRISIIDPTSGKERKVRCLKPFEGARFINCCNGLALFTSYGSLHQHIVINPLSKEIIGPFYGPYKGGDLCGFFFHPVAKEFRILSVRGTEIENNYEYQIYQFGAKKWRKAANPYFHRQPTRRFQGRDWVCGNAAFANNALHWYNHNIGEIMLFDIIDESFSTKPLPSFLRDCWMRRLLVKDDHLCFCCIGCEEPKMDVWILEDYEKWGWTKRYVVNLSLNINKYPVDQGCPYFGTLYAMTGFIRVVGIWNDELVLFWRHRGLFLYHLGLNTIEKIHLGKSEMDKYIDEYYDWACGFQVL